LYTRRAFLAVGLWSLLWIACSSRLPQIGAFLTAAGIRRRFGAKEMETAGEHASEWSSLRNLPQKPLANSCALVTYHPWYEGFRPGAVDISLSEAAALGAGYLRSDVRWSDVMPDGITVDERAFDWYRGYFKRAREVHGLKPLIVLANPPGTVKHHGAPQKLAEWRSYVSEVVHHVGDLCDIYQVMNEPNNPVYSFFDSSELTSAVAAAAEAIREWCPASRICVNATVDWFGWKDALKGLCEGDNHVIDILGLDHYPGTWAAWADADWDPVQDFLNEVSQSDSSSAWFGRQVAVMETGYSSNLWGFRDDGEQADFFRSFARFLSSLDQKGTSPFALVGFYELLDWDSEAFLDPEAHFGLITSGSARKRKEAFFEVQRICVTLAER
jgi:hypothetical protein